MTTPNTPAPSSEPLNRRQLMTQCPRCFKLTLYADPMLNCLSRRDNRTYICQTCGTEEALIDAGMIKDYFLLGVDKIFSASHKPSDSKASDEGEVLE